MTNFVLDFQCQRGEVLRRCRWGVNPCPIPDGQDGRRSEHLKIIRFNSSVASVYPSWFLFIYWSFINHYISIIYLFIFHFKMFIYYFIYFFIFIFEFYILYIFFERVGFWWMGCQGYFLEILRHGLRFPGTLLKYWRVRLLWSWCKSKPAASEKRRSRDYATPNQHQASERPSNL